MSGAAVFHRVIPWCGSIAGVLVGAAAGKLLAELVLMHYGIASYGVIHRIETVQIGTQTLFAVIGAVALGNYGLGIGRALQSGSHQVTVERAAPVFMAAIAGLFALLVIWQAARLIEAYLHWRIYVDAEAFEPIKATVPPAQILFGSVLAVILAREGYRLGRRLFAPGSVTPQPDRLRFCLGWLARLAVALAAAMTGIGFGFDIAEELVNPVSDFVRPLAHEADDLRWFHIVSFAALGYALAIPLAIFGYALGRWLPLATAAIGFRLGSYLGALATFQLMDFFDDQVRGSDDLAFVYMRVRLVVECSFLAVFVGSGYWLGRKLERLFRVANP